MTESIPNSAFRSHGFQYDPLEADRVTDFAVEYWHCRFDLDKKKASLKELQESLKQVKYSFKKATDTNMEMRKAIKLKDVEVAGLHEEITTLKESLRREKQTNAVSSRTISKNRLQISSLETELKNKVDDFKDMELRIEQMSQAWKTEAESQDQKIHMLSERNAKLSTNLRDIRETEGRISRQLEDVKIERDHLLAKTETQRNVIEFKDNAHFSEREKQRPTEDVLALEEVK